MPWLVIIKICFRSEAKKSRCDSIESMKLLMDTPFYLSPSVIVSLKEDSLHTNLSDCGNQIRAIFDGSNSPEVSSHITHVGDVIKIPVMIRKIGYECN